MAIGTAAGLLPTAVVAAGYRLFPINPLVVSRYRDRYGAAKIKSDPGDAFVLANIARTDLPAHRPLPADSELVQAIRVLARARRVAPRGDPGWRPHVGHSAAARAATA